MTRDADIDVVAGSRWRNRATGRLCTVREVCVPRGFGGTCVSYKYDRVRHGGNPITTKMEESAFFKAFDRVVDALEAPPSVLEELRQAKEEVARLRVALDKWATELERDPRVSRQAAAASGTFIAAEVRRRFLKEGT
jgi:hypothetical protein